MREAMVLRIPTASIRYRKEFNSANKNADETLKNWYDRLKDLAKSCDYGSHLEAFILNQFICGLDALLLEYLRTEQKDLSVNDVFDLTKSFEHSNDLVNDKQVWVSIKTEELDLSDGEHCNDNTFNDNDDDEQEIAVNNERPIDQKNGATCEAAKENIPPMVASKGEKAIKPQKDSKSFECYICHKTFKNAGKLTYHFTCFHSIRKKPKSKSTKKKETPQHRPQQQHPQHLQPKSFECYLCHEPMKTAGKLVYHYTVYHLIGKTSKCTLCDKWVPDTSNMVRHLNHHFNESEFTCTNCGAGFKTNRGLKIHLLAHSDPKTELFHCTKCPNIFIAKARFKDHMEKHKRPGPTLSETFDMLIKKKRAREATKDGKFKCDVCAAYFDKASELDVHSKVHNKNEFLCHHCGAKLISKRNLLVHYLVHTNEKPFKCDICGHGFATKIKCTRHVRTHHGTGHGRKHQCEFCDKAFIQKGHLKRHIESHINSRFRCDQCPRHFFKEDQLARHKLFHDGVTRPWKCNYCEKTFKTNYCRVEHERLHTGERPYSCPICNKRFAQQATLRGHRKVHSKPPRPPSKRKRKPKNDTTTGSSTVEVATGAHPG